MNQLEAYLLGKEAEASGTHLMPLNPPPSKTNKDHSPTKTIPKTGEALEQNAGQAGEQYQKAPQAKALKPHVDVSGKEPPKLLEKKEAQYYALPSLKRYPLDSYVDVKTAGAYFDQWSKHMAPVHRREFCSNLTKRASALGIEVSDTIEKYGSSTYAPAHHIEMALDGRRSLLLEEPHKLVLEEIKMASVTMPPDQFAELLSQFDRVVGIDAYYDSDILDPYLSTYGVKSAEVGQKQTMTNTPEGAIIIGNDYITKEDLKKFSLTKFRMISTVFGDDMAKEFQKDPVAILNSLPLDQKKMIVRMAADNHSQEATLA